MLDAIWRLALPMAAGVAAALVVDHRVAAVEAPPGFAAPWRRAAASALLAGIFYLGVFASLGAIGIELELDLAGTRWWELFTLHGLLVAVLVAWGLLAYAGSPRRPPEPAAGSADAEPPAGTGPSPPPAEGAALPIPAGRGLAGCLARAFRLESPRPLREIALGLGAGVAIWGAVLSALVVVSWAILSFGGEDLLPRDPPGLITFLVDQPAWVRLAAALSAGLVEETFFRGFLQPRVGLPLSTLLFVLAHFAYGQPFMLIGVALLSVIYGLLARHRGDVWAAATAHAVFDAVQLLVVVPWVVRQVA